MHCLPPHIIGRPSSACLLIHHGASGGVGAQRGARGEGVLQRRRGGRQPQRVAKQGAGQPAGLDLHLGAPGAAQERRGAVLRRQRPRYEGHQVLPRDQRRRLPRPEGQVGAALPQLRGRRRRPQGHRGEAERGRGLPHDPQHAAPVAGPGGRSDRPAQEGPGADGHADAAGLP